MIKVGRCATFENKKTKPIDLPGILIITSIRTDEKIAKK